MSSKSGKFCVSPRAAKVSTRLIACDDSESSHVSRLSITFPSTPSPPPSPPLPPPAHPSPHFPLLRHYHQHHWKHHLPLPPSSTSTSHPPPPLLLQDHCKHHLLVTPPVIPHPYLLHLYPPCDTSPLSPPPLPQPQLRHSVYDSKMAPTKTSLSLSPSVLLSHHLLAHSPSSSNSLGTILPARSTAFIGSSSIRPPHLFPLGLKNLFMTGLNTSHSFSGTCGQKYYFEDRRPIRVARNKATKGGNWHPDFVKE